MSNGIITKTAALRIAMATRVLSEVNTAALVAKLGDHLGLPVTEEKLSKVTVADLKLILSGEETVEPDVDSATIKLAVRHLWGESGDLDDLPPMDAYAEGDMPGSLRGAVAANTEENLDGHFGSCPRFLIYQVGRDSIRLIDARSTLIADDAEDNTSCDMRARRAVQFFGAISSIRRTAVAACSDVRFAASTVASALSVSRTLARRAISTG